MNVLDGTESDPLFVKCDCSGHAVEMLRYNYVKTNDRGFYISFWKLGPYTYPMKFKEKLRWCWSIWRTGKPFSDGVIISDEKAKELASYINNELAKNK